MADASQWKVELEAEGDAWKAKQDAHAEQTARHVDEIAELYTLVGESPSGNPSSFDSARDCPTAGTSTAYTASFTPAFSSLVNGIELKLRWHTDSGADPTLDLDGLGEKAIKQPDGTAPPTGSLKETYTGKVIYNATLDCWVLVSNVPVSLAGYATEAYADAAAAAIVATMGPRHLAVWTGNATHNFNPNTTYFYVEVVGGGGGGGAHPSTVHGVPGGGGGFSAGLYAKTAASATITVGAGGAGGTGASAGSSGGTSSFADGTRTLTANGGAGGAAGASGYSNGGAASGGQMNIQGSEGQQEHGRGIVGGAAYMCGGAGAFKGRSGEQPGAGGGSEDVSGAGGGGDGFRGEVRIWEFY